MQLFYVCRFSCLGRGFRCWLSCVKISTTEFPRVSSTRIQRYYGDVIMHDIVSNRRGNSHLILGIKTAHTLLSASNFGSCTYLKPLAGGDWSANKSSNGWTETSHVWQNLCLSLRGLPIEIHWRTSSACSSSATYAQLSRDPTNFRGLVLGCIEAKFCK